jgi:hypothetical protein
MESKESQDQHRPMGKTSMVEQSKSSILSENRIEIKFCSIGCTIRVGCKEVAFSDNNDAMDSLVEYVNNPDSAIKMWMKEF